MSITRTVVRNVVRDVVRAVIRGEDITRFFTESNSITQTYGQFTSTVTLATDFEIELSFTPDGATRSRLLGEVASTVNYLRYEGDVAGDIILVSAAGNARWAAGLTISQLNTIKLIRSGSSIELFVNGVSKGSLGIGTTSISFSALGMGNSFNYFDGILANLKIINAGTLVVDSPIDDAPDATYFRNIADPSNPIQKFNYVEADTLEYVFDGNVSPNTWTDVYTGLMVIEVAGT